MLNWLRALDRVLRGEATSAAALESNDLDVPIWGLCVLIDLMGLAYGLCMGVYNLAQGSHHAWQQAAACMVKVPALFVLTLLVTLPSLYVFNAMVGSRLSFRSMMRLLVAALAVMLAVLASIGPIVAFFSFTTTSYPFMILLNVLVFGIAGCLGMAFLLQSLHRMTIFKPMIPHTAAGESTAAPPMAEPPVMVEATRTTETSSDALPPDTGVGAIEWKTTAADAPGQWATQWRSNSEAQVGPLHRPTDQVIERGVRSIFRIWVLVFSLVGTQMAWVLRPFVGHGSGPFVLFRAPGSNFFIAVWQDLIQLTRW